MMHKEVVTRRKVIAIVMSVLCITLALYIYEGIKLLNIPNEILNNFLNFVLAIFVLCMLGVEYRSCKISYKYSLIADKFIINQIEREQEKNVESVKISNIVYIGTKEEMPRNYSRVKLTKNCICDGIIEKRYVCVYKKNEQLCKINFQPSEYLVERINKIKRSKGTI